MSAPYDLCQRHCLVYSTTYVWGATLLFRWKMLPVAWRLNRWCQVPFFFVCSLAVILKYIFVSFWSTNPLFPLPSVITAPLRQKEKCQSIVCHHFWWCSWPCVCLPGLGSRHNTSSGQPVVSGLPVHHFRLRCGVPPSCVCQRQFGLIYRPLTHSALDPTSAAGMAIPCVGGGSTWVVLHWWGSDVVLLTSSRSSGEHALQTAWRESALHA